jgi:hypothetical protein
VSDHAAQLMQQKDTELEPAEKQFVVYATREADAATVEYQQAKLVFEKAAETYRTKVNIIQGFLSYLAKKYSLGEAEDIDVQGNIITRS